MPRKRVDWKRWRDLYVSSPDTLTLEALSEMEGSPAIQTLKRHSSEEGWTEQRRQFRRQAMEQAQVVEDEAHYSAAAETAQDALAKVASLLDAAEILSRHMKAVRVVGQKAAKAIGSMQAESLSPREALAYLKFAIETERLIEGMVTARLGISYEDLSDEELDEIIEG